MLKMQRVKLEMFGRVKSFGADNRDLFPEDSVAGKTFAQLAAVIAAIEAQIVRWQEARSSARKVKGTTRGAALRFMRAVAATGRRAATKETGPHPFRMPTTKTSPDVLGAARLFRAEAERRKERFLELGMAPTFLADFDAVIKTLEDAIKVQQDSRGARGRARAGIKAALVEGMHLVADLDVTVANALANDPERLGQWEGARHMDHPVRSRHSERAAPATSSEATVPAVGPSSSTAEAASTPFEASATPGETDEVVPAKEVLKPAS